MPAEQGSGFASRWRRLWRIDPRSLAAFRIGAGSILLVDLVLRLGDWRDHYTDLGVMPRDAVIAWLGASARASLHMLSDAPAWSLGLFAVHLLAAAALAAGWRTRIATVVCWILTTSLHARDPAVVHGGDTLLRILLFWSMFLPLGARWSLDARSRRSKGRVAEPGLVPCAAILLQVCFVYWFTVALKWTPAWLGERTAVAMALDLDYMVTSWGRLLRDHPELLAWLTTATLALEAIGPLLALSPYATGPIRFVVVLVFVEFHLLGLGAAIHLGIFPWVAACAWLLFLPTWLWRRVLRAPDAGETAAAAHRRGGARPLRDAVVGLLLVLVLLLNLVSVWPDRLGWLLPAPLRAASRVLGLNQSWQLFAPSPPSEDGWYVMPGLLESGEVVDVWSGGGVRFDKPDDVAANYGGGRWVKLLSNLSMSQFSALRPPFLRWLCRRWNEDAPSGRRLTQVDLYFVIERFEAPEAQPEPIFLLGARCLEEAQNTASGLSGETPLEDSRRVGSSVRLSVRLARDRLGLDLHQVLLADRLGSQQRVGGRAAAEDLAVHLGDRLPVGELPHEDSSTDHVVERGAELGQRALDLGEHVTCLLGGVARRDDRAVVGGRGRPRDDDPVAGTQGAAVAEPRLPREPDARPPEAAGAISHAQSLLLQPSVLTQHLDRVDTCGLV